DNPQARCRAKWIGPGRGWVDPVKEAKAADMRIQSGISTYEQECAEQGLDWEEQFEQRAREKQRMEDLGLVAEALGDIPTDAPQQDEQGKP
ncbi:MAG: phage portal protein, partial [Nitrospirota bacterium]|nr:phage portal protein [Nitrospirota bacterium]